MAELSSPWLDPENYSRWGVDWLRQPGRFLRDRKVLTVWTGAETNNFGSGHSASLAPEGVMETGRVLRGRRYLLAPTARPEIPGIAGLSSISVDTIHSWIDWPDWPQSVAIVGALPEGIALAQLLARVGCRVFLFLPQAAMIPALSKRYRSGDAATARPAADATSLPSPFAIALLSASGVKVVQGIDLAALELQRTAKESCLRIQAPGLNCEVERLLVATAWVPQLEAFRLEAADLSIPLAVDAELKTRHHHVYAVGAAIFGSGREAQAIHEATVATQRALWSPWRAPALLPQPRVLWTLPPQVQIGLDSAMAEQRYPAQVWTMRSEAPKNWRMQLADAPVGFCELVVHRSGRLLGARALAAEATEWMGVMAMALHQKMSVEQLATLPSLSPSFGQLLIDAAAQFRWQRLARHPRHEDLLERFFNWRRTGGV